MPFFSLFVFVEAALNLFFVVILNELQAKYLLGPPIEINLPVEAINISSIPEYLTFNV
jgi:hypothetical protein